MTPRAAIIPALVLALTAAAARGQPPPAAAAPPPTPLGIARCIWGALPMTTRAALVASGPSIDDIGKAIGGMNPALMQLAQSQCPPAASKADAEAAKDAWAGVVMTKWSEGELAARYQVKPTDLARAWSHVPGVSRSAIAAGFDKTPEAARPAVAPLAAQLKLTDPAALDLLNAWAIAEMRLTAMN